MSAITARSARLDVPDGKLAAHLAGSTGPVVVAFSTAWCRPCRLMAPLLSRLADEFGLPVIALDAGSAPRSIRHYAVEGFPELLMFRDGALAGRVPGFQSYGELRRALAAFAAPGVQDRPDAAERAFGDAVTAARDAFEASTGALDAAVARHIAAVAPELDAAKADIDRQVEAGLMTASEGSVQMRAAQIRAFLPFQDEVDAADDAEERALDRYAEAVGAATERSAAALATVRPACAGGQCRLR